MPVSVFLVSSFLIALLMMLMIVSMRFQGLLGAVDAVDVLNGWWWSAANLERVSGQDPICNPSRAQCVVCDMGTANAPACCCLLWVSASQSSVLGWDCCDKGCVCRQVIFGCVCDKFQEKSSAVAMVPRKGVVHFIGSPGGGSPRWCVLSMSVLHPSGGGK